MSFDKSSISQLECIFIFIIYQLVVLQHIYIRSIYIHRYIQSRLWFSNDKDQETDRRKTFLLRVECNY